jgi:hypothetical protein
MRISAFLFTLSMLADLCQTQATIELIANRTSEHRNSHINLATGQQSALVTGSPLQLNDTAIYENGMATYDNATFATSCAYSDSVCVSECSWHTEACSRTWADWYRTGLVKSMNTQLFTTETESYHEITQSLKVVDGYTYAMGPEITTKSGTKTVSFYNPQLEVVSTLVPRPSCSTPDFSCTQQSWCNTNACTVQGGTVELLFWPAATRTPGFTNNGTLLGPVVPVTAVYKNMTLTSPSVYLEYKTAYALNGCSQKVGGHYPGAILALDPDDLFSIDARNDFFIVTTTIRDELRTTSFYQRRKMNYDHLTGLPDGAAYQGMPMCVASGCNIITPSLFHPQLVVPTQIREMDPAWVTCGLDWRGSWDPPIALTKADTIAVPTTPTSPVLTNSPPVFSRPIPNGPAKMTDAPNGPAQTSSTTSSTESPSSDQQLSATGDVRPSFTLIPLTSGKSDYQSAPSVSRDEDSTSTASSVVRVTTVVQIGEVSSASTRSGIMFEGDPVHNTVNDGSMWNSSPSTHIPGTKGQQSSVQTENELPSMSSEELTRTDSLAQSRHTTTVAEGTIITWPDGGLEVADTVISAGGEPITIGSTVYSAALGGALVIVSESPTLPSTHSPTNAYEVLSEALGTAVPQDTQSFLNTASKVTRHSLTFNAPSLNPTSTNTLLPEAVINLSSTTITATQVSNSLIRIGGQQLDGKNSVLSIGGHTLSTAPNAIVFDGTTESFTTKHAQHPTVLTLSSTLLTAQEAGPSGAIEIDSHTLMPGSSALITEGHTLSAASSGLMQDGSLVATENGKSFATSVQSLTSFQAGQGSELPSVVSGPAIEGGEGQAASSSEASSDVSSGTGQSRQMGYLSWAGAAVFLLACIW